jgi:hypothetical protein
MLKWEADEDQVSGESGAFYQRDGETDRTCTLARCEGFCGARRKK